MFRPTIQIAILVVTGDRLTIQQQTLTVTPPPVATPRHPWRSLRRLVNALVGAYGYFFGS